MLGPSDDRDHGPLTPPFSRRRLLEAGHALLMLALVAPAAAACGSKPAAPDPLEEQLAAARRDSDLATAASKAAPAAVLPALVEVAAERARHAAALIEELARAAGKPIPTETLAGTPAESARGQTSAAASAASKPPGPPPPPPSVADVATALRRSAESAAALVPALSGYRAGLLGSIAAACTTAYQVGLPAERRPQ